MSTTTRTTTARRSPAPTTPAQRIAAAMIPDTPPCFCEAMEDTDLYALFEQIRDDQRGCTYDAWYTQLAALEQQIKNGLPESERGLVNEVETLFNHEEQNSMEAAYLVGVEVGKRMAGR